MSTDQSRVAHKLATYENVSDNYLRRRQLIKGANSTLLWALGVGAVISGDFYGWNYGLAAGGFWGLTIATAVMAIMYFCLVYCLAELSAALPHAGGLYSFTRNAFGPYWGFICGVVVAIEYILATAALVFSMSNYLKLVAPNVPAFLVWLLAYGVFGAISVRSLKLTLDVSLLLTLVAIVILVTFYLGMLILGLFNPDLLFNIPADPGQPAWLPKGWAGVFAALPYGIWFYLAIEMLPFAAEETRYVRRDLPKSLISGMVTLLVLSIFTLVLNSAVGGGAAAIGQSSVPLGDGLEAYFGKGFVVTMTTVIALTCGLGASLPTQIYAYGRILFALSRAGYIPRSLSVTNNNAVPANALILGTVIGFICVVLMSLGGGTGAVDAALLNMAVFGAVISYIMVMFSYIKLKIDRPDLTRPYQSPLGIGGAAVGSVLAIVALGACISVPGYRAGVWGIAIALVVATIYFFTIGKNRLVAQAPEEAAALSIRGEFTP
jgi:ethanolamine permease